jgi:hypothetical protein
MTKDINTFDVFVGCFGAEGEKARNKRHNVGKYEDAKTRHFDINNSGRCNSGLGIPPPPKKKPCSAYISVGRIRNTSPAKVTVLLRKFRADILCVKFFK